MNDDTLPTEVVDEKTKYVNKLKDDLDQIIAAQGFQQTSAGKLIIKILTNDVERFSKEIASDKFMNNHMGYVDARAKLSYAASLLTRLNRLNDGKKEKKIRNDLKAIEEEDKGAKK